MNSSNKNDKQLATTFFVILYFCMHASLTEVVVSHLLRNLKDDVTRIRIHLIHYRPITHCARRSLPGPTGNCF